LNWTRDYTVPLRDLQSELDRFVDRLVHGGINTAPLDGQDWAPPIDLFDESDRYVLIAEVPGMAAAEIDVSILDQAVILTGVRPPLQKSGQISRSIRSERRFGRFRRRVDLPDAVDETRITATCAAGVLTVSLPKQEVPQGKKVTVESIE
jgi:HSP20 family protein